MNQVGEQIVFPTLFFGEDFVKLQLEEEIRRKLAIFNNSFV